MTTRRIKLTRYAATTVDYQRLSVYRLRIVASDATGPDFDNNVFIFRRNPPSPWIEGYCDDFQAVAGPVDMAEIPAGEPDADHRYPFYRLSEVTLDFRSQATAEDAWQIIQKEVAILVEALGRLSVLVEQESAWFPNAPPIADESTSSQSV